MLLLYASQVYVRNYKDFNIYVHEWSSSAPKWSKNKNY